MNDWAVIYLVIGAVWSAREITLVWLHWDEIKANTPVDWDMSNKTVPLAMIFATILHVTLWPLMMAWIAWHWWQHKTSKHR